MIDAQQNLDGKVTLSIGEANTTLNADLMDELLAKLGNFRAQMIPPPTFDAPLAATVDPTFDPRYWVESDSATDTVLLLLRDTGFGWVSFLMPPAEAEAMARLLTAQGQEVAARVAAAKAGSPAT